MLQIPQSLLSQGTAQLPVKRVGAVVDLLKHCRASPRRKRNGALQCSQIVLEPGMLSVIRGTIDIVSEQRGERLELQNIPPEDLVTYDLISRADTIGVQIESCSQMSLLPRMQLRTIHDLVIEVAIIWPRPIRAAPSTRIYASSRSLNRSPSRAGHLNRTVPHAPRADLQQ
jgi:hypothetical protein